MSITAVWHSYAVELDTKQNIPDQAANDTTSVSFHGCELGFLTLRTHLFGRNRSDRRGGDDHYL